MTKSQALAEFAKKFYDIDVAKNSPAAAVREYFKKQYDIDAEGNSVAAVLEDVIENNESMPSSGGGDASDGFEIIPDFSISYPDEVYHPFAIYKERVEGVWWLEFQALFGGNGMYAVCYAVRDGDTMYAPEELYNMCNDDNTTLTVDGFNMLWDQNYGYKTIDNDDPAYAAGNSIDITLTFKINGVEHTQTIPYLICEYSDNTIPFG